MIIYLHIIDCNQNFVYSNNMNALLLPDLIQSMLSWYLWKNKISLLNKQYHEVFECTKIYEDNDHYELYIFQRNKARYPHVKFNWRYFWTLPKYHYYWDKKGKIKLFNEIEWDELIFINSWKFDRKTNKYERIYRKNYNYKDDQGAISSNYFYTNDNCHEFLIPRDSYILR
jgi:hypothetical protein